VDSDLKASLIASGSAAALSAIVGWIFRVPFGTLAIRAIIGAIVFGAMVFGAIFLVRRFLPELLGGSKSASSDEEYSSSEELGQAVNIVLPGGSDEELGEFESVSSSSEPEELAPLEFADSSAGESSGLRVQPKQATSARVVTDEYSEAELSGASLIDEERPTGVSRRAASSPVTPSLDAMGIDDLDDLPDLDSLSDGFAETSGEGGTYNTTGGGAGAGIRSGEHGRGGSDADPATLALAVRTLLKRDQKG